ncbi:MAG: M20/M25/M40 family metallo-hydrolase [Planctomycetes bacterium]|nr:M20/M25/M40 family metallo-hydrolase [Planctomycetota bacterium]
MLEPRVATLHMLGLGLSVGTPAEGITAPVVVVADEEELNALGDAVRGKIVLFNNPMPPYDAVHGSRYGPTVKYRGIGARISAAQGAVACLVRSVTAKSLRSPHTGAMRYGDAEVKIPAAAISVEDAEMIARLQKRGIRVVVNLKMDAKTLPDAPSANVIGELRGSTHPEEVVVIGGHLDSWDVGHGAHDDGAGCVMAMEAINVLRKLNMRPRRTIRVVLWTNEENGLAGGRAYAKQHADELDKHVAAIESDSGAFAPRGYSLGCSDEDRKKVALRQMRQIMRHVARRLGSEINVKSGGGGADISPLRSSGVVLMGHRVEGSTYFDYHHTHADTIDKVDPKELSRNVAMLATVAYILADMPQRIGETAPR